MVASATRVPADRSGWRRGFRGVLACAAMLGALFTFFASQAPADRWTYTTDEYTLDYTTDGPHWVTALSVAVAIVLVVAAGLLWAARRPGLAQLGYGLLVLAGVGWWLAADAQFGWGHLPGYQLQPVGVGAGRSEVREALRSPAGYGTFKRRGGNLTLGCWIYERDPARGEGDRFAFCFRDDRVVKRIRW